MNASRGPGVTSSRSHRARAPGTEMALGRSSTSGREKTLRASSSTTSRSGFCSSWVCGLAGVVLGRDPLLFGKILSFISLSALPLSLRFVRCREPRTGRRPVSYVPTQIIYISHEHGQVSHRRYLLRLGRRRFVRTGTVVSLFDALV